MYLNYGKYLAELFSIYSLPKKKQKYSFHKFYSTFELLLSNFIRTFSFSAIAVRNFFFLISDSTVVLTLNSESIDTQPLHFAKAKILKFCFYSSKFLWNVHFVSLKVVLFVAAEIIALGKYIILSRIFLQIQNRHPIQTCQRLIQFAWLGWPSMPSANFGFFFAFSLATLLSVTSFGMSLAMPRFIKHH